MSELTQDELLKDRRVIDEINRHLWVESERAGQDIGIENATADWLQRFSSAWMDYHMPDTKVSKEVRSEEIPDKSSSKRVYARRFIVKKRKNCAK